MKVNLIPEKTEKVDFKDDALKGSYEAQVDSLKNFLNKIKGRISEARAQLNMLKAAKYDLTKRAGDISVEEVESVEQAESELLKIVRRIEALLNQALSQLEMIMSSEGGVEEEVISDLQSQLDELEEEFADMKGEVKEEIEDAEELLKAIQEGEEGEEVSLEESEVGLPSSEFGEAAEGESTEEQVTPPVEVMNPEEEESKEASIDGEVKVAQEVALDAYKEAVMGDVDSNPALSNSAKMAIKNAVDQCSTKECVDEVLDVFGLTPPVSVAYDKGGEKVKKADIIEEPKSTADTEVLAADSEPEKLDSPGSASWVAQNRELADQQLESLLDEDRGPLFEDPEAKKFIRQFAAAVNQALKEGADGVKKVALALVSHPIGASAIEFANQISRNTTRMLYSAAMASVLKGMEEKSPIEEAIESELRAAADAFGLDIPDEIISAVAKNASVKAVDSFVDAVDSVYKKYFYKVKKSASVATVSEILKTVREHQATIYDFGSGSEPVKTASVNPNIVAPSDVDNGDFFSKLEKALQSAYKINK